MKILSNVTIAGGATLSSNSKDQFTIGTELERDNPDADNLTVWANARFNNDVTLGSSSADIISIFGQLTASGGINTTQIAGNGSQITNITASNISNFTTDVRNQLSSGTNIVYIDGQISLNPNVNVTTLTASDIRVTGTISASSNLDIGGTATIGSNLNIHGNLGTSNGANQTKTVYAECTNGTVIIGGSGTTVSGSSFNGISFSLSNENTLPSVPVGGLAVSGSKLYFYSDSGWKEISLL